MKKKYNKLIKKITIDQLAGMIKEGFDKTASKEDLDNVKHELGIKVDRIENLILTDYRNRIERLEDKVLRLKTH